MKLRLPWRRPRPRAFFRLEELEPRLVPSGSSYTIPLDPTLDQFGDQVATVQAYADPSGGLAFGLFDTGATAVTFSADDLTNNFITPIPVKVPGGAIAGGIGGTITGDVSEPGTILADGMHAASLTFDNLGFPIFDFTIGSSTAQTSGIQAFLGTQDGSPIMPTITGTPILSPSPNNPKGLEALIDMQGASLDFSSILPGVTLTMPDIHFVQPGTAPTVTAGATTDPFYVSLDTVGNNNYADPGNVITETPSPLASHVSLVDGAKTLHDQHFLLDTGAQLTVISTSEAQQLGLDLAHPETSLDVEGVAGTVTVPGFTLPELDLPTTDGGMLRFTNVPIYVLDVDPSIDGLLGTNLFNTAASITYDPFTSHDPNNPGAGSLGVTFYTDPNRGADQIDPGTAGLLQSLGVSFAGTLTGHKLPGFSGILPPSLTNPGSQLNKEGDLVHLAISAKNANHFAATGLPTGLTINSTTGLISGTIDPRAAGSFQVTVTASDNVAKSSATFTWTVNDTTAPALTAPVNQTSKEGDTIRLAIQATDADRVSAIGLPSGLSMDPVTGLISGTIGPRTAGVYRITVTATDAGTSRSVQFTWVVSDPQLTSIQGQNLQATEGASTGTVTLATFVDPAGSGSLADYAALILWGDGTTKVGTIADNGSGHFSVTGSHTYGEEGTYHVQVWLRHKLLGTMIASGTATVADAPLTASGVAQFSAFSGVTLVHQLATFTDADPSAALTDYRIVINWGDGTPLDTTTGRVTGSGTFLVSGMHTYHVKQKQTFTVTITIRDRGTSVDAISQIFASPLTL
jgi:predicted aspartyl protease